MFVDPADLTVIEGQQVLHLVRPPWGRHETEVLRNEIRRERRLPRPEYLRRFLIGG
jgi:hypothetical protein